MGGWLIVSVPRLRPRGSGRVSGSPDRRPPCGAMRGRRAATQVRADGPSLSSTVAHLDEIPPKLARRTLFPAPAALPFIDIYLVILFTFGGAGIGAGQHLYHPSTALIGGSRGAAHQEDGPGRRLAELARRQLCTAGGEERLHQRGAEVRLHKRRPQGRLYFLTLRHRGARERAGENLLPPAKRPLPGTAPSGPRPNPPVGHRIPKSDEDSMDGQPTSESSSRSATYRSTASRWRRATSPCSTNRKSRAASPTTG